jgi:predicted permease
MIQALRQDIRYVLRQLRKAPGFTATAVATLALGIGITATVGSVARQVLLAPLPYPDPQRLVGVAFTWPGPPASASITGPSYEFLERNIHSFSNVAILDDSAAVANLSAGGGHASSIAVQGVSHGYFATLGMGPALGRTFTAEEDLPGGAHALVLSHGLWMRAYGGDPSILGRTLRLNQESVTVVGVMPAGFHAQAYLTRTTVGPPDAWRPIQLSQKDPGYGGDNYQMYARLKPGVTLPQAQGELASLEPGLYRQQPDYRNWKNEAGQTPKLAVSTLAEVAGGDVHDSLLVMLWATGAVLLLTNVNLAGLNTARALRRGGEFALRTALGASRGRLLRLAVLEVAVLALGGVAGAVVIARLLLPLLLKASPVSIPTLTGTASAWAAAALAAVLGAASAALFGLPLALAALLQSGGRLAGPAVKSGQTQKQVRAGQSLIVLQIGLAVVLVATAFLLLGTFLKLRARPVGFEPDKLVVFQANLKGDRYAATGETARFVDTVLASLRQTPGVASATAINGVPFDRGLNDNIPSQNGRMLTIQFRPIAPGYLETIGLGLVEGRALAESDTASGLPVALVSVSGARRLWPGRPAIGSTFPLSGKQWRIVGVVRDAPNRSLAEEASSSIYVPIAQMPDKLTRAMNGWFPTSFVVRMAAHLDATGMARRAVAAADPEIPTARLTTMRQMIDNSVAAPRFFTELAAGFGGFSLLLTAVGLFGLLNYQVTQRTHEIGIRMALGASREAILRGVLAASGALALLGSLLGVLAVIWLRPLLAHWITASVIEVDSAAGVLFSPTAAIVTAIAVLAPTTFCAAAMPARRAAAVEPMVALKSE